MHFERAQSGSGSILRLKGRCTIEHATELKAVLIDALDEQEKLVVDLGGVSDIDLSCLQLLCSAHGTSSKRSKSFTLDGILPEVFKRIVNDAGYCRDTSCLHNPDAGCPWKGGWK
jgi:anti-anti-sigma regulatory factor